MCGILFFAGCARQEPTSEQPTATWELQPSVATAYYENQYWQIDVKVLINSEPAPREAVRWFAGRLKGVYTATGPDGGGESNYISGFWRKEGVDGLTMQITPDPGHRLEPGTRLTVTISDSQSEHQQNLIVEIPPNN